MRNGRTFREDDRQMIWNNSERNGETEKKLEIR